MALPANDHWMAHPILGISCGVLRFDRSEGAAFPKLAPFTEGRTRPHVLPAINAPNIALHQPPLSLVSAINSPVNTSYSPKTSFASLPADRLSTNCDTGQQLLRLRAGRCTIQTNDLHRIPGRMDCEVCLNVRSRISPTSALFVCRSSIRI